MGILATYNKTGLDHWQHLDPHKETRGRSILHFQAWYSHRGRGDLLPSELGRTASVDRGKDGCMMLCRAVEFQRVWSDRNVKASTRLGMSIWKPLAPPGYVSLGFGPHPPPLVQTPLPLLWEYSQ